MRWRTFMLRAICGPLLGCVLTASAAAQEGLAEFHWLIGDWSGKGEGEPGTSTSERHAREILDDRFLRVDGRSVYPKQERNPEGEIHAEMDIWSHDRARKAIVLRQFDTLGFVTTYVLDQAASTADRWVLNAEHLENVPQGWRARYLYTRKSQTEYEETLELDTDGKGFKPYVTNRFTRIAPARD
jgi:hypothetical protein